MMALRYDMGNVDVEVILESEFILPDLECLP